MVIKLVKEILQSMDTVKFFLNIFTTVMCRAAKYQIQMMEKLPRNGGINRDASILHGRKLGKLKKLSRSNGLIHIV